jgi:chromosome segregation ATPase
MVFNFPSIHKTLESNTNNPMKQTFNDTYEQSKCEEYKTLNSELQREINMKKSEIESLNEELTEERNKVEECHSELRKVKDEVEDLNRLVKKKNTAINNLQMQLSEGDALNNGAILSSQSIKMAENYKRKSENRSFEQRSSMSLHNRV